MNRFLPVSFFVVCLTFVSAVTARSQVLALNFSGSNGTNLVDQFTGTSGSGWATAWTQSYGADTVSGNGTVVNSSPIYSGGGDYLDVSYNTGSGANRGVRVSRQWNTSAISLTEPIVFEFYFRSDTSVINANQSLLLFGSTAGTSSTGGNDSWKITMDGGGVTVFNSNTAVSLATAVQAGTNVANTPLHFTLAINPVTDTYTVSMTRLDTNVTFTSGTLALRNGADASLSYFNFVSNGGANQTGLGFALDGLSVVPEPSSAAAVLFGLALAGFAKAPRRKISRA
jgi:hypothetical protein